MKWTDTTDALDIDREPTGPAELAEAADAWKMLRHLTSCAGPGFGDQYELNVKTTDGIFRAVYLASESTSGYSEIGFGDDPIEAIRNLHDCMFSSCDDPKHRHDLFARWTPHHEGI